MFKFILANSFGCSFLHQWLEITNNGLSVSYKFFEILQINKERNGLVDHDKR